MKVIEDYTGIGGGKQTPTLLVIHAMGEYIKTDGSYKDIPAGVYSAHEWLQLDGTSAHFLLHPNGDFTKQRSTKEICWHAKGFNTNSIGIEVLVKGTYDYGTFLKQIKKDWVTSEQYTSLVNMSKGIITFFNINSIKRHSDLSPDRKQDPGLGFKWTWFLEQLNK